MLPPSTLPATPLSAVGVWSCAGSSMPHEPVAADLGGRLEVLEAGELAGLAGHRAGGTDPEQARGAGGAAARVAFVDLTAAVVVLPVAALGARLHGLVADDHTVRAARGAGGAH